MPRSVVLLSGGLDSAVAAALEKESNNEILGLWICHGQRTSEQELRAAKKVSVRMGIGFYEIRGANSGAAYAELTGAGSVIPVRNLILCAIAANFAEHHGSERVVIGSHAGDHALFPDCRPEFFASLNTALYLGGSRVKIHAPFAGMTKAQVVAEGRRLAVPLEMTWSCYANQPEPCGECLACTEREKALTGGA